MTFVFPLLLKARSQEATLPAPRNTPPAAIAAAIHAALLLELPSCHELNAGWIVRIDVDENACLAGDT
jgi:hypothetical protein